MGGTILYPGDLNEIEGGDKEDLCMLLLIIMKRVFVLYSAPPAMGREL